MQHRSGIGHRFAARLPEFEQGQFGGQAPRIASRMERVELGAIGFDAFGRIIASGVLPPGLMLSPDGALTGTASAIGRFDVVLEAMDANGESGTQSYSIEIVALPLAFTLNALPSGRQGESYLQSLGPIGGVAPYLVELSGGALPAGLTLDSDGVVSGTPTEGGTFTFTVTLTDSNVPASSISQTYSLSVGFIAVLPQMIPTLDAWMLLSLILLVALLAAPAVRQR